MIEAACGLLRSNSRAARPRPVPSAFFCSVIGRCYQREEGIQGPHVSLSEVPNIETMEPPPSGYSVRSAPGLAKKFGDRHGGGIAWRALVPRWRVLCAHRRKHKHP